MPELSQNVRFLLWKKGVARAEWAQKLTALLGWYEHVAELFLTGESVSLREQDLRILARFGGVAEDDLTSKDLLAAANLDFFHENISFLIDLLPHGEKKRFAEKLGVDATTISRWKNGAQKPTKQKLRAIVRYFGLSDGTNLAVESVFLTPGPVGIVEMRDWLYNRISKMDEEVLRGLFPAFARLMKSS